MVVTTDAGPIAAEGSALVERVDARIAGVLVERRDRKPSAGEHPCTHE